MQEQERGSQEVLAALKDINIITGSMDEMSAGAAEINNAVQEVNELTVNNNRNIKNLYFEVNKFKV